MEVVEEYASALKGGATFPPLVVFTEGRDVWLGDGFHRLHACRQAGISSVECDIHHGTRDDAIEYAVGANVSHGLRRTNADKRRSVEMLLTIAKYRTESARLIAEKCGVDHKTAQAVLQQIAANDTIGEFPQSSTTKDGRTYPRKQKERKPKRKEVQKALPLTPEQKQVAAGVKDSVKRQVRRKARHKYKGIDATNFTQFEDAIALLARYPMTAEHAAGKYLGETVGFNVDLVRDAHKYLGEFLAACGQEIAA